MKFTYLKILFILQIAIMTMPGILWASKDKVVLTFHKSVQLDAGRITLGDIADIYAPAQTKLQLRSIEVGYTGIKPGQNRILNTNMIVNYYVNPVTGNVPVEVKNSGTIKVTTVGVDIPGKEIQRQCELYLDSLLPKDSLFRYTISLSMIPQKVTVPKGEISMQIQTTSAFRDAGRQVLKVLFYKHDKLVERVNISANIQKYAKVLVSAKPLRKGDVLALDDLRIQEKLMTHYRTPALHNLEQYVGYTLKRSVGAGKMLRANYVEAPYVVTKGEQVRVHVKIGKDGSGSISTTALAEQNGRVGDLIQLQNTISHNSIIAKIDENGELWVTE
jgi:flagellar basal body P-ring formation protein FlgA